MMLPIFIMMLPLCEAFVYNNGQLYFDGKNAFIHPYELYWIIDLYKLVITARYSTL